MNRTDIIGNLTADPEIRTANTANGARSVCNFTVAVNRSIGERKVTDYFRVNTWGSQADICVKYLSKGKKVRITGIISAGAYIDKDGKARGTLELKADEIEFLSPRPGDGQNNAPSQNAGPDTFTDISSDDIPF